MFQNRIDAGLQLAAKLSMYEYTQSIVLAVPRGGVPIAYIIAKELRLPLDLVLIKKIGHPTNKEYAIGATSLTDYFVIPHAEVSQKYIDNEVEKVQMKLKEMYIKYMENKVPVNIEGKTVIVVDDGVATGNTLSSTINMLRKLKPTKIVIAVAVASKSAYQMLKKIADEVVSVIIPEEFHGVGGFYQNFAQVTDQEVMYYLGKIQKQQNA